MAAPKRTPKIVSVLREHQESHPTLGGLFTALHKFADRTSEQFFPEVQMPKPVLAMEKDRRTRLGYYTEQDGYALVHRINLNPYSLRTGAEAAETLAHEMVHEYQAVVGRPCKGNYHGREFHDRMLQYGIVTRGTKGFHAGYDDSGIWQDWMERNDDLQLDQFMLPGLEQKERRQLMKFACPDCGTSVRSRKILNLFCLDCNVELELVKTRSKKKEATDG